MCEWKLTSELEDDVVVDLPDGARIVSYVVDKGTFPWGIDSGDAIDQTLSFVN